MDHGALLEDIDPTVACKEAIPLIGHFRGQRHAMLNKDRLLSRITCRVAQSSTDILWAPPV